MTILQSLARRYDRLALAGEAPIPGFAPSQISFTIVLDREGRYLTTSLREKSLGRTKFHGTASVAKQSKDAERLVKEHAAFRAQDEKLLDGTSDVGCTALLAFLRRCSTSTSPSGWMAMQASFMTVLPR